MRMKFVRNTRSNRRELIIATQRGEAFNERHAKLLAREDTALLAPFAYEVQRGGTMMRYDVEGLWSLKTFLAKRPLGTGELVGLLRATQDVLDLASDLRLHVEGIFFDPEYVFVNGHCEPCFVLVPVDELSLQERNSPLTLLKALGEADHLRFATPDADALSRRVATLVVDMGGVFSANVFRRFLEGEAAAASMPAGEGLATPASEPGTSSTWATAGGTPAAAPVAEGSLFWSPLSGLALDEEEESKPQPAPEHDVTKGVPPKRPSEDVGPGSEASGWPLGEHPLCDIPEPASMPTPEPVPVSGSVPLPEIVTTATPAAVNTPPSPVHATPTPQAATLVRLATGDAYPLAPGTTYRLGRGSACEIRLLGNPKLSRQHASITWDGATAQVCDLGAANGVWVGGMRLTPQQTAATSAGQAFRLAGEEFVVRIG